VHVQPKSAGQLTAGHAVSWDNSPPTGGRTGSGKFGAVIAAADTTDATCKVRLSGVPTAAA
jgi:hypothetical protein